MVCEDMQEAVSDESHCVVKETSENNASLSMSSDFVNIEPAKSSNDVEETGDNASPSENVESVESKNCPEAIAEYLQYWTCQAEQKKKLLELSAYASKHLLSTGWKIPSNIIKGTFISPEKYKRYFYSLQHACSSIQYSENCPKEIKEYLWCSSWNSGCSTYWPKAIKEDLWCSSWRSGCDHGMKKSLEYLSASARKHLLATGWKILSSRGGQDRTRQGRRKIVFSLDEGKLTSLPKLKEKFTSPWKKDYCSLIQACKAVRDAALQKTSKENLSCVLPSSANAEPKERMNSPAQDKNRESSSRGFSLSQEAVDDEFFNMLDPEYEAETDIQPEEMQAPSVEVAEAEDEDESEGESEDDSEATNGREKKKGDTNSIDDFVYHPQEADKLLLDPSWLPTPPALLSESMNSQHTSANQMAALILYATSMLAQKASSSSSNELVEKVESQAARIAALEAEQAELSKSRDDYRSSYEAASEQVADLKREAEEQREKLRVEREHWEEGKKKEIGEAEEAAVSRFVGSSRMTSWVNYYNRYRGTLILQMVRAQTAALGLKDFQVDLEARLGFPAHPPPYRHPPPGTFADDGDRPIDAWQISELKSKTVLAEGVSPSALPNPCLLFKTPPPVKGKGSGTKRKAEDEAKFATTKKSISLQPKKES